MTESRRKRSTRYGLPIGVAALVATAACGKGAGTSSTGTGAKSSTGGMAPTLTFTDAAGMVSDPIVATPDAMGQTIYFIAKGSLSPTLFSVPAAGGTPTPLMTVQVQGAPVGLAFLPSTGMLYVADKTYGVKQIDPTGKQPSTTYGVTTPAVPLAIDVDDTKGTVYFTSQTDGTLYSMSTSGANITAIAPKGSFVDPEGVAVLHKASAETVFVVDRNDGKSGKLYKVMGGAATVVASGFFPGTPSGVAVTLDESKILVSALDATGAHSEVDIFDATTFAKSVANDGIQQNVGSGGLHRAYAADVFAWAGITNGTTNAGLVYQLGLK